MNEVADVLIYHFIFFLDCQLAIAGHGHHVVAPIANVGAACRLRQAIIG